MDNRVLSKLLLYRYYCMDAPPVLQQKHGEKARWELFVLSNCRILTYDLAQNAIQGDAPEGSDTFQWQLGEEIAWAEIG